MQQERTHSGASAKRQKRLVQGIIIGGFRMWNSADALINRGPAHANLKRVLAACPLRANNGPSSMRLLTMGDIGASMRPARARGKKGCR